jgi:Flp pilus assembly protein TadD
MEVQMRSVGTALAAAIGCALRATGAHAQMGGGMAPQSTPQREDPAVPYRAGVAAFNAGDYAEAIRQLRTARRASPSDGNINYALGLAYSASGEREEARTALERAARARNAPIPARLQLGLVALALGDREAAAEQQAALQRMIAECDAQCGDARRGQMQSALNQLAQALEAP